MNFKLNASLSADSDSMHTSYKLDAAAERCLVVGLLRLGLDGRLRKTRAAAAAPGPAPGRVRPSQSSSTQAGPLTPISQPGCHSIIGY